MRTLTDKKNNAIDLVCDLIAKRQKKAKSATMQQLARLYFAESNSRFEKVVHPIPPKSEIILTIRPRTTQPTAR